MSGPQTSVWRRPGGNRCRGQMTGLGILSESWRASQSHPEDVPSSRLLLTLRDGERPLGGRTAHGAPDLLMGVNKFLKVRNSIRRVTMLMSSAAAQTSCFAAHGHLGSVRGRGRSLLSRGCSCLEPSRGLSRSAWTDIKYHGLGGLDNSKFIPHSSKG